MIAPDGPAAEFVCCGQIVHVPRHELPIFMNDGDVPVHHVQLIGNDDPRVRPAEAAPVRALILPRGRSAGQRAVCPLAVAQILHVFAQEVFVCAEIHTRLRKDLRIGSPAEPFVPLRTVRGNAQIVGILPPADIADELIDIRIGGRKKSRILRDRGDDFARNFVERHGSVAGDLRIAESVIGKGTATILPPCASASKTAQDMSEASTFSGKTAAIPSRTSSFRSDTRRNDLSKQVQGTRF